MTPGKSKTEKTVYFVRHGESVDNIAPVFQRESSPLSENGRRQAELIAGRVRKIAFDALISSPSARARQTAEAVSLKTGKPIEFSDLFVERQKPLSVQGKPNNDESSRRTFDDWEESLYKPGMRVEDGENFDDLMARAKKAIDFLTFRTEPTLVVVTHGFFMRTILAKILLDDSMTPENFKNFQWRSLGDNTGISAIKYMRKGEDARWRLWIHNDHAHLAE